MCSLPVFNVSYNFNRRHIQLRVTTSQDCLLIQSIGYLCVANGYKCKQRPQVLGFIMSHPAVAAR